ncbi:MAG: PAS domain-containing protein [bacterium]
MERENLRAIVLSIDDIVLVLNKDFQLLEFYQSLLQDMQFININIVNYVNKSMKNAFPKSTSTEIERLFYQCMKTGKAQQLEISFPMSNQWFNVRVAPIRDMNKNITGAAMVIRDITQRIDRERAIAQSEKKYHEIFEQSPQDVIVLDAEGKIKICEWLGYKPEAMIGKDHILYPFLTKSGKIIGIKKFIQRLSGKYIPPYELEFIANDGTTYIGEIDARPIKDEKGIISMIVVTDVTRRH